MPIWFALFALLCLPLGALGQDVTTPEPDWVLIGKNKAFFMFISPRTLERKGGIAKAWFIWNFKEEQPLPSSTSYRSLKLMEQPLPSSTSYRSMKLMAVARCSAREITTHEVHLFTERNGTGTLVGSEVLGKDAGFMKVSPDTAFEKLFNALCAPTSEPPAKSAGTSVAFAKCKDDAESLPRICASGSPWTMFSRATIDFKKSENPEPVRGTEEIHDGGDFLLAIETGAPPKLLRLEFMMVDKTTLLLRGPAIEEKYAFDYMDAVAVPLQMPISILDLALPQGPEKLIGRIDIAISEDKRRIDTGTMWRADHYGVPWRANGYARRIGADQIEYEISIAYKPTDFLGKNTDGPNKTMTAKGVLTFGKQSPLPNDTDLAGWRLCCSDKPAESATPLSASAYPVLQGVPLKTTGALRKAIETAKQEAEAISRSAPK